MGHAPFVLCIKQKCTNRFVNKNTNKYIYVQRVCKILHVSRHLSKARFLPINFLYLSRLSSLMNFVVQSPCNSTFSVGTHQVLKFYILSMEGLPKIFRNVFWTYQIILLQVSLVTTSHDIVENLLKVMLNTNNTNSIYIHTIFLCFK